MPVVLAWPKKKQLQFFLIIIFNNRWTCIGVVKLIYMSICSQVSLHAPLNYFNNRNVLLMKIRALKETRKGTFLANLIYTV